MISYYELLGLIKEGKQPDKVKYKYFEYEFHEDGIYINENSGYLNSNLVDDFGDLPLIEEKVIEIIEDKPKQIEKLDCVAFLDNKELDTIADKVNELIDKVNYLLERDKQ